MGILVSMREAAREMTIMQTLLISRLDPADYSHLDSSMLWRSGEMQKPHPGQVNHDEKAS
jgi:hypothetical protein